MAAISAEHVPIGGVSVGRHLLVSRFLQGMRRLRPFRPVRISSWDLAIVKEGLAGQPFEPLESVSEKFLTLKTIILVALSSLKRIGDLQALSVSLSCMDFDPGLVKVLMRPRPRYVPKVMSTPLGSQQVVLETGSDARLLCLCPVRALKVYVDRSVQWCRSEHWVIEAISAAYEARGLASLLGVRAHSTRGMASSQALFRDSSLEDICVAAGWSSPNTFSKFYSLDVRMAPGSQVLSALADTIHGLPAILRYVKPLWYKSFP